MSIRSLSDDSIALVTIPTKILWQRYKIIKSSSDVYSRLYEGPDYFLGEVMRVVRVKGKRVCTWYHSRVLGVY